MVKAVVAAAFGATLALLSGCTSIAGKAGQLSDRDVSNTRYWLHPKLGMVKIDAATGAMVTTSPAKLSR